MAGAGRAALTRMSHAQPDPPPPLTLAGCLLGARLTLPFWPGIAVFGAAFGAAATQKGLPLDQALGMSAFVYAGASQMVALEAWRETWSLGTILGVMTVTAFVNARMILMGVTLQRWLRDVPTPMSAALLFLLVDVTWLVAMRHGAERGRDLGVFVGASLLLWPLWIGATLAGCLAGSLLTEPRRYGLDLLMPILFCAMLVPLWRGWRPALPWAASAIVALAVQRLAPGYAFIIAGALAGMIVGALVDDGA